MPYVNTKLLRRIPEHLEGVMEYYPDVLLFDLNQIQYNHLWHELSSAKYIYTNGYEVRPTNWFMYGFQKFKGWLGFSNNCHPEKVSYALNKLAYYGYSKQFIQPDFTALRRYSMSAKIAALVNKKYENTTTAQLQTELVKDYFKIEPYLNIAYFYQRLRANHHFGESWVKENAAELVPQLDPQDDGFIEEVLQALEQKKVSAKELYFIKDSKFAKIAAQYYSNKAKNTVVPNFLLRLLWTDPRPGYLAAALVFDPEIAKRDSQKFIELHLKQKDYQSAFNLLEILSDPKLILKFLLEIPETERNALIQKDTPLAAILANYHLEKKQYALAQQLYSNIETLNPAAAFSIEIQEKNYVKAYEIFQRQESMSTFSRTECITLAEVFFTSAETEYETGKTYRSNKNWKEAEQYYLRSLEQKKAAFHLHPTEEYQEDVHTHKRLYSLLLIDTDIDLYKPEDSNIASIQKAITLLRECQSSSPEEQAYQKQALARALMRRVDTLREKIAVTYTDNDYMTINQHKIKHQQEFSIFVKTLKEIIKLLAETKDKNLLILLGKAHYLLADVLEYFSINDPEIIINQHYKMAMDAVPENPFYLLRVAELFEDKNDKIRNSGVIKLKNMGYQVMDFVHWSEERWVKRDKIIYDIKDIHQAPVESTKPAEWSLLH